MAILLRANTLIGSYAGYAIATSLPADLLTGETDGMAIDFTVSSPLVQVRTSGVDVYTSPASFFTATNASGKTVQADATAVTFLAANVVPIAFGLGLLVEIAVTNKFLQSEDLSTTWTNTNSSEVTDAITAPNGSVTADKLVEDATVSAAHSITQSVSLTSGTTYTQSVYAKAGERDWIALSAATTRLTVTPEAWFDLTNGVVGTINGAGVTSKIEAIGNGWFRCSMGSLVCDSSGTNDHTIALGTADNTGVYTGDGVSGAYFWGAQLEDNPRGAAVEATSYIPTTTATVLRTADLVEVATSAYPHSDTAGTFIVWIRAIVPDAIANPRLLVLLGAAGENIIVQRSVTVTPDVHGIAITTGSVAQTASDTTRTGTISVTNGNKYAVFYKLNDSGILADGGSQVVDTSCTMPTTTLLSVGTQSGTVQQLNGYIRRLIYVPRRMTQTEMQARTT